jgi:hypothetical protein
VGSALQGGGLFSGERCTPLRIAPLVATAIPVATPPPAPACPDETALRTRMSALLRGGHLDRAQHVFARMRERCPEASAALAPLAQDARETLTDLGKKDPAALVLAGHAALARGDAPRARPFFDAALLAIERREGKTPVVEEGQVDPEFSPPGDGDAPSFAWRGDDLRALELRNELLIEPVKVLQFTTDGRRLLIAGRRRLAAVLDLSTGALERTFLTAPPGMEPWILAADPTGRLLGRRDEDALALYDARNGAEWRRLDGHDRNSAYSEPVNAAAFSWDGQRIATGDDEGTLRIFGRDGARLATFGALRDHLQALAWSPDGRFVASAFGSEAAVRIRDTRAGETYAVLPTATDGTQHLAWSAGGRHLAAADISEAVRVWDLGTCRARPMRDRPPCHRYDDGSCGGVALFGLSITPAGDRVAGAFDEDGLMLWDGESGRRRAFVPIAATDRLWDLAFSADGSLLAVGSLAGTTLFRAGHGDRDLPELDPLVRIAYLSEGDGDGYVLDLADGGEGWPRPAGGLGAELGSSERSPHRRPGHYDAFGRGAEALVCRIGGRRLPAVVCEDRLRVPGLLARRSHGLPTDPLDALYDPGFGR